ncbi:hypothetical protein [Algoriphagus sp.]|uniref:hypothetical protein n=1 Tax=Algoriphagus sp. TaxID=1872435 RepID=UPI003F7093DE
MNKGLTLLGIFAFIFQGVESFGQSQTYLSLYRDQLPYFQELITGAHYEDPPNSYVGHPYLLGRDFQDGILTINNVSYTDVPLLYNMHEDELVTFHPIYQEKIWIKPEKVEAFQFVEGELFQRFSENETYPHHKNGFYEVVSDGEIKVLVKHYKKKAVYRETGRVTYTFLASEDFFYWWNGEFAKIKNGNQAMKALRQQRLFISLHDVIPWQVADIPEYFQCQVLNDTIPISAYEEFFGSGNFVPATPISIPGIPYVVGYQGTERRCADCTLRGTNVKPDFWDD